MSDHLGCKNKIAGQSHQKRHPISGHANVAINISFNFQIQIFVSKFMNYGTECRSCVIKLLVQYFAGVHDMQAAGHPAVAALGTKPAPTPAKSVSEYYYDCYSMTRSISSSIQIKPWLSVSQQYTWSMVGGSKYIWIFSTSNALIISSQLFSIVSSGRDSSLSVMTFVTL